MSKFEKTCISITAAALIGMIAVVTVHQTAHPALPTVVNAGAERTAEPWPERLATGPISVTVSRKDEDRMAELLKRDVTNNGGFVISHGRADNDHELTFLASQDYMERIARLEQPGTPFPDHQELQDWAMTVVNGDEEHKNRNQDTQFTVRVRSPFTDNLWSRYALMATFTAAAASALALVIQTLARGRGDTHGGTERPLCGRRQTGHEQPGGQCA